MKSLPLTFSEKKILSSDQQRRFYVTVTGVIKKTFQHFPFNRSICFFLPMEIMPTSVCIKFTIRRRGQIIRSENLLRKGARTELPYSWLKLVMDLLTRSFLMRRRQDRHISPTLIGAVFVQSWKLATVWVGQLIPLIILQPGPISLFSPHWSGEEPGDPDRKYATDTFSIISKYPFKRRLRQIFKHIQRRSKTLQDEGLQKTVNFLINKYPLYIITWVFRVFWMGLPKSV